MLCELSSVNIACALRQGAASIGITLLGVAHLIRKKHFRCEPCVDGQFSFGAVRVKKPTCGFYNYFCDYFCKIIWNKIFLACTNT